MQVTIEKLKAVVLRTVLPSVIAAIIGGYVIFLFSSGREDRIRANDRIYQRTEKQKDDLKALISILNSLYSSADDDSPQVFLDKATPFYERQHMFDSALKDGSFPPTILHEEIILLDQQIAGLRGYDRARVNHEATMRGAMDMIRITISVAALEAEHELDRANQESKP